MRGDSDGAAKLINSGVLDEGDNKSVYSPYLYFAAQKNDTNVMAALFTKGVDVNYKRSPFPPDAGRAAVHGAAMTRSAEALRMLLDRKANATLRDGYTVTPFELSVQLVEPPGPVTDMLIEAGAKPTERGELKVSSAGTHWALASYQERHGNAIGAISNYRKAAEWYERASKEMLGSAKFMAFLNTPFMRSTLFIGALATGAAVSSSGGVVVYNNPGGPVALFDPNSIKAVKGNVAAQLDKGERYAAYSKLCADRANELNRAQDRSTPSDSSK